MVGLVATGLHHFEVLRLLFPILARLLLLLKLFVSLAVFKLKYQFGIQG